MTDFRMHNSLAPFQKLISMYAPKLVLIFIFLLAGVTLAATGSAENNMMGNLDKAQALFNANDINIEGKYKIFRFVPYQNGGGVIWVVPLHEGLPVLGNERAFHFRAGGEVMRDKIGNALNVGHETLDLEILDIEIDPIVSPEEAMVIFSNRAAVITIPTMTGKPGPKIKGPACAANPETLNAALVFYDAYAPVRMPRSLVVLAWKISCADRKHPYGLIDAQSGAVLYFDSGIRS